MFEGIYTALITPYRNGTIDRDALMRLVDRQISANVQGLVVAATTGEGALLAANERQTIIEDVLKRVDRRVQVIVGTGEIDTRATVESTKRAAALGADAALVVAPAYVKPSQQGLLDHFERVANQGGLPIIMYNVPSRTQSDLLPESVAKLAAHERIVGIKEATGSILRVQQVIALAKGRLDVLSGDDPVTVSLLLAGGQGVICTASNAVPKLWADLWKNWTEGQIKQAATIQAELRPLHEALFLEANPGPIKAAMHLLGLIEPEIRTPLSWPKQETINRVSAELETLRRIAGDIA